MDASITVALVEKRHIWDSACAIYAVPTSKAGTVFMRVTASNYRNDQRAVVVVDAQKFLAAWQRVRAEVEMSHRADRELIRGWGPTG